MSNRILIPAALAGLLLATLATAEGGNTASASASAGATATTTSAEPAPAAVQTSAKTPWPHAGQSEYKERINLIARKPLRHDIQYIDSKDRGSWNGYTVWQGVRDERPLVARKTMGFHDPRPHRTRKERVLLVSRGPIKGPAFQQ